MQERPVSIKVSNPDQDWQEDQLIYEIVLGLSRAISKFNLRQPTRVALLLANDRQTSPLRVFDPQGFLDMHKSAISSYFDKNDWRGQNNSQALALTGIEVRGFNSVRGLSAQWFIEEPLGVTSELTFAWMAEASELLFSQLPLPNGREWSPALVQAFENRGQRVVHYHLKRFTDQPHLIPLNIIQMIAELTTIKEEGSSSEGRIIFGVDSDLNSLVQVSLRDQIVPSTKYVRKLLTAVAGTSYSLLVTPSRVLGFAVVKELPKNLILAQFSSKGASLSFHNRHRGLESLVQIRNGEFFRFVQPLHLSTISTSLQNVLPEANQAELLKTIEAVVTQAQQKEYGCTLAIFEVDSNNPITGRYFQRPMQFRHLEPLLPNLAHIDGAIHLNSKGEILAFGCLLDGKANPILERPEKGARHNSAVRFTFERPQSLLLVVSEDGPITVFTNGKSNSSSLVLPDVSTVSLAPELNNWRTVPPE